MTQHSSSTGVLLLLAAVACGSDSGTTPNPTSTLAIQAGNNQVDTVLATLATQYAVLVRDQNSDPIAGVTVTWSAPSGTILPATSQTNASGIATATRTLGGTAGAQTAQAAAAAGGSPVTFTATANAGNAAVLLKTSGDGGTGSVGTPVTYTVTVQDSHGNPKAGQQVNWTAGPGDGPFTSSGTTIANGQASAIRMLTGTTGLDTVTAVAPNNLGPSAVPAPDTVRFTTTVTALPTTATVTVGDNIFNPDSVRIAVGGTVTWDWGAGGGTHNVTFANVAGAPTDIGDRNSGTQPRTFASAGAFNYQCTIHANMNGKVVAQ